MIDYDKRIYYGYPETQLTMQQIRRAISFNLLTQPWLEANIGTFGNEWFVELDKEADSLRILFKEETDEVTFKLAWMQGAMLDETEIEN
jgi:hypothetical protein